MTSVGTALVVLVLAIRGVVAGVAGIAIQFLLRVGSVLAFLGLFVSVSAAKQLDRFLAGARSFR